MATEATKSEVFKGIVKTTASPEMTKSTGKKYVLFNVELLDGKGKGLVVPAQRNIEDANGNTKAMPELGQEVVVYMSTTPDKNDAKKTAFFFEIGMSPMSANQDELRAIFG